MLGDQLFRGLEVDQVQGAGSDGSMAGRLWAKLAPASRGTWHGALSEVNTGYLSSPNPLLCKTKHRTRFRTRREASRRLLVSGPFYDEPVTSPEIAAIRLQFDIVSRERDRRRSDPALDRRVQAVKSFQHARLQKTYEDLLNHPRFDKAARFFLDDLYGPRDFTRRDEQFARVIPTLVRLFPKRLVETVTCLIELHALTECFDTEMALQCDVEIADAQSYKAAWQRTGRENDRVRQVDLTILIGRALDSYTKSPILRHSLRAMRRPARVAGLGDLQAFLEAGFDTFGAMGGAEEFLSTIERREKELIRSLFTAETSSTD